MKKKIWRMEVGIKVNDNVECIVYEAPLLKTVLNCLDDYQNELVYVDLRQVFQMEK